MRRYKPYLNEANIKSKIHKDLNLWSNKELNKSPKIIHRGETIETISSFMNKDGNKIREIKYRDEIYYVEEDIFYASL